MNKDLLDFITNCIGYLILIKSHEIAASGDIPNFVFGCILGAVGIFLIKYNGEL